MSISSIINKGLAEEVGRIYQNAELTMLDKLAKKAEKDVIKPGWATEKTQEVVDFRDSVNEITANTDVLAKSKVDAKIKQAYQKGVLSAEKDFGLKKSVMHKIKVPPKIENLVLETQNLIGKTNFKILRESDDIFRQLQAHSAEQLLTGVETRRQATQRMLNKMADNGITGFVDKAGRKWQASSYAEMSVRTVSSRAALSGHIDRQLEAGRDLVIISDHAGSCPVCVEFAGRIFSLSGDDTKYPSLDSARAGGLFHPNCRHTMTGYIEGLHKPGSQRKWDKGKQKQIYQYEQKQRHNERQIRKWKKRKAVAITDKERVKATKFISHYQTEQRYLLSNFDSDFGMTLRRKYEREGLLKGVPGKTKTSLPGKLPEAPDIPTPPPPKPKPKPKPVPKAKPAPRVKGLKPEDRAKFKRLDYEENKELANELVSEHSRVLQRELPKDLSEAITTYTGSSYSKINRRLRHGGRFVDSNIDDVIKRLNTVFKPENIPPLKDDIRIFRRVGTNTLSKQLSPDFGDKVESVLEMSRQGKSDMIEGVIGEIKKKVGNLKIHDKGFASTTYRRGAFGRSQPVEIELLVPKGSKHGYFVESVSSFGTENEFLVKNNVDFRVVDVEFSKADAKAEDCVKLICEIIN